VSQGADVAVGAGFGGSNGLSGTRSGSSGFVADVSGAAVVGLRTRRWILTGAGDGAETAAPGS
jgi:hypothetical protein